MDLETVFMPKYGMTMEAGIIVEWLVKEGDHVEEGDSLAVIETEKVSVELEAPVAGVVVEITVGTDAEIPVGEVIAYIEKGVG
jgi:pyruvate/2-oxoglutarate dehydrogenase complex dihydrolipoamide acyltransferase (E2) component